MDRNSQKGFSLVELLIAILIVSIVSTAGLGIFNSIQKSTRDAQRESDLRIIQSALQQYYADVGKYPNELNDELDDGDALTNCSGRAIPCTVSKTYLSKTPKDPQGAAYYFNPVASVTTTATSCSISANVEINTCYFYFLCAKKEEPDQGDSCFDTNYNFQVTPL